MGFAGPRGLGCFQGGVLDFRIDSTPVDRMAIVAAARRACVHRPRR
jgi:hypothetical protein